MGIPFQAGLRYLGERHPEAIPWGWAINATTSVLDSVVTILIALHAGFTASALFGAGAYAFAAWFVPKEHS